MENASKALLIAASVLIAIALIAIGIRILSATSGVTTQVDRVSSTLEASIFNSQFTKYEGNQKGSDVKALLRLVINSNTRGDNGIIGISFWSISEDYGNPGEPYTSAATINNFLNSQIKNNDNYTVEIITNDNTGLVERIQVYLP